MIHIEERPSEFVAAFRSSFRDMVRPGRALDVVEVCELQRQLNTAFEMVVEMEAEFAILSDIITPPRPAPVVFGNGQVIPFRRRPTFHLVGGPDGGDAA